MVGHNRIAGDGTSGVGHSYHVGGIFKYVNGPWLGSVSVSGSYGKLAQQRTAFSPLITQTLAQSTHETLSLNSRLRFAYSAEIGQLFVTPRIDLDTAWVYGFGSTETGNGGLGVTTLPGGNIYFDLQPAVRLGTDIRVAQDTVLRPYIEAGLRFGLNDGTVTTSTPNGTGGVDTLTFAQNREDFSATVLAGAQLVKSDAFEVKAEYSGRFGTQANSHSLALKLGFQF